ncbi:MAG: TetR/AcrR family transcriptional regulator [Candidatus Zixiibacteriota bacterium]|nr:MAG: TetR/AcrR family transcriptional regulator [candidate division Zixibacteria bacterium]
MPPKIKYTREDVISAAFALMEQHGLRELTARGVASRLGSSTAPVYKHFATMDELALEVIRGTQRMLLEYTSRPYTDRVFLNMGTGVAMFACEHSRLYRALLLEGDNYGDVVQEFLGVLESELTKDPRFTSLSTIERRVLLQKMWTFTHGLASLICVGLIKDCDQEYIVKTLMDVGADVIGATLAKHKNRDTNKNNPGDNHETK